MVRSTGSRREFLEMIGGASAAAAGTLATLESARGYMANDTIEVACLGTGGRCRTLMKSLAQVPGVRIAAVCDIYDAHLDEGKKLADPKALATKHYRELLDRKDIDAVLIGSPDHWHVPMSVDACNAGKDVYVEKPLTHDLAEGTAIIEAQNRNRRIVQVGMQQRSMPHIQKGRELVKSWADRRGLQGPPELEPRRHHAVPSLADGRRSPPGRLEGLPRQRPGPAVRRVPLPQLAMVLGFRRRAPHRPDGPLDRRRPLVPRRRPSDPAQLPIGNHFASKGVWQTPDTIQCILEYPNNVQAHFEGTFSNATYGAMITFMGTDGTLYIDRGRYELTPEHGKGKPESWILGSNPQEGGRFLRQARWRAAPPDQLGGVRPQPAEAERPGRGGRRRRGCGTPRQPRLSLGPGGGLDDGVITPRSHRGTALTRSADAIRGAPGSGPARRSSARSGPPDSARTDESIRRSDSRRIRRLPAPP